MSRNRKLLLSVAAVAVIGVGAGGIAYAVGGDSEEQVTGPDAERAKSAALDAVGGGKVLEAEHQEAGGAGVYEVEVQRPDGSQVEVQINGRFEPLGTAVDDDSDGEDESRENESAEE